MIGTAAAQGEYKGLLEELASGLAGERPDGGVHHDNAVVITRLHEAEVWRDTGCYGASWMM